MEPVISSLTVCFITQQKWQFRLINNTCSSKYEVICMFVTLIFPRFYWKTMQIDRQKTENSLLLTGIALFIALAFYTSCANQGMPTGGPKDTLPPILLQTSPAMRGLNFTGSEVRLTFDEFIIADAVSEDLVVSPPLQKRPSVRTRSRNLIVEFNEDLKQDVTYSLDFKNSIVDNNERNPYNNLRIILSTGPVLDTLRVAGVVKNGFNLEKQEKILVMLHSNLHDSAVVKTLPDYIARTDARGLYLFDNVKAGNYRLYALNDGNRDMKYNPGAEEIAFADSIIIPFAEFRAEADTLVSGADSLLIVGNTYFFPEPIYLRTFTEKFFDQYIEKVIRETRFRSQIVFNEPVDDTLGIRLFHRDKQDWFLQEHSSGFDTITLWVTDTLVAALDTLRFEIAFTQLDSLNQKYIALDTLSLVYTDRARQEPRRRSRDDEEEKPEVVQFTFSDNVKTSGFDLNVPVLITAPEPVYSFDTNAIRLVGAEDLTDTPLPIKVTKDTLRWRTWQIQYPWEPNTSYILEIDSATFTNIYGITNRNFRRQFTTQKEDFYGSIILHLSSVNEPLVVQLLDNSKDEKVMKTLKTSSDGKVTFDFLAPNKYKVKIIFDSNNNGEWDTGSLAENRQPERVAYLPEIVKVRSNWENEFKWDLKSDPTYRKELIDKEEEELRLKRQQEERQKQEQQDREPVQMDFGGRTIGAPGRR